MKRRDFITLLGGAASWPLAARAQQPAVPVIGFLHSTSPGTNLDFLRGFHRGLKETGYVEGENVSIVYRWAEGQNDRLPNLAAELVRQRVAAIAAFGGPASISAAKAATTTIPIVFNINEDPVRLGYVASLSRPGGNLTGINFLNAELVTKRLEFLRELVPAATRLAVLVNPSTGSRDATVKDVEVAARAIGLQSRVFNASVGREIDAAFAAFARERPDGLFVAPDPFFLSRRVQLVHWASRHAIPATYSTRDFTEAGGLVSYGTNLADVYRQVGTYVGRILKGAKPADLPVAQSTKFELVINLQTARILDLAVPPSLLALADEVIE
jgi:putative ABC transport system substrate-binding protein